MSSVVSYNLGRPPLLIAKEEYWDLMRIAITAPPLLSSVGHFLIREIDRASQIDRGLLPNDVVRMYSKVRYLDNISARQRSVTLVYPGEECPEDGLTSILTSLGAALIGLSVDHRMTWTLPSGAERDITVLEVSQVDPAEVRSERRSRPLSSLS